MKRRMVVVGTLAGLLALPLSGDLLACGDKYLCGSRGTRYQRPKNARAAAVLIYARPESQLAAALKKAKADTALKHEGHRATTVESLDQLTTALTGGHFDVVLADGSESPAIERLVGAAPDAAVVVAFEGAPRQDGLLRAIDKGVERHDENVKRAQKLRTS